jgi:hypothetical protein
MEDPIWKRQKTCAQLMASTGLPGGWKAESSIVLKDEPFLLTLQGTPAEWTAPLTRNIRIMFVHGCIWYTDVVTNSERTTEFCYMAMRVLRENLPPNIRSIEPPATISGCVGDPVPFVFK